MRSLLIAVTLLSGCLTPPDVAPDAAPPPDGECIQAPIADYFGEACQAGPATTNTTCHTSEGWCIAGSCLPMCSDGCDPCPGGRMELSYAGACYCEPG